MRENVLPTAGAFHDAGKRPADGGSISRCGKASCRRQGVFAGGLIGFVGNCGNITINTLFRPRILPRRHLISIYGKS